MIERKSNFISKYRKMPPEFNIFLVLLGMALLFEILCIGEVLGYLF